MRGPYPNYACWNNSCYKCQMLRGFSYAWNKKLLETWFFPGDQLLRQRLWLYHNTGNFTSQLWTFYWNVFTLIQNHLCKYHCLKIGVSRISSLQTDAMAHTTWNLNTAVKEKKKCDETCKISSLQLQREELEVANALFRTR